jgi:hypothetical protein
LQTPICVVSATHSLLIFLKTWASISFRRDR